MAAMALTERYAPNLHGVLSCYDRIIVTGTLPGACYAGGMTSFLFSRGIRIFDYPRFAEPLRERIRERAAAGLRGRWYSDRACQQEPYPQGGPGGAGARRARRCAGAGACDLGHGGLPELQALARQEQRPVYLRPDQGKCLHYYFYFIDEELGLCYLRVPTWAPFRLQFYCNGHSALARTLTARGDRLRAGRQRLLAHRPTSRGRRRWPTPSTPSSCTAA